MMTPEQDILLWRYATKKFNAQSSIPTDEWASLESAMRYAPSSLGLQLWKFIIVNNQETRQQLCEASHNQTQVSDCSHYVVLCGRRDIDNQDINDYVKQIQETRHLSDEQAAAATAKYMSFAPRFWADAAIMKGYIESQIHLAAGFLAHAAASMHIDTCIIGGMIPSEYDKILQLDGTRYRAVLGMAFGYRASDDAHANDAKVRYPASKVIEYN